MPSVASSLVSRIVTGVGARVPEQASDVFRRLLVDLEPPADRSCPDDRRHRDMSGPMMSSSRHGLAEAVGAASTSAEAQRRASHDIDCSKLLAHDRLPAAPTRRTARSSSLVSRSIFSSIGSPSSSTSAAPTYRPGVSA